jgi:adenylate kinase
MLGRAAAEGRPDDAPGVIRRRLELYHEQTAPVVERYRATGKLVPLHAARTIDAVYAEIQDALALVVDTESAAERA